jgi:hypothetical protein
MTCVAYREGFMACDSCYADDDTMITRRTKIMRLASGALLGLAGDTDSRHVEALFMHVKTPRGLPTRKQLLECQIDYHGLLVLPKGRVYFITICPPDKSKDHEHWYGGIDEIGEGYHAIGSGSGHALTAMDLGKSAKDAVAAACRRNLYCKPPIHVVPLKKPIVVKLKPKRKAKR